MKHLSSMPWLTVGVATVALTSACAVNVDPGGRGGQAGRALVAKANADPSLPLPLLQCDPAKPGCVVPVQRTSGTPTEDPVTGTWNCGVQVPELVLLRRPVEQLRWTLPDNLPEQNAFRFRVAPLQGIPSGVFPYAREALNEFTPLRVSDTVFEFTVKARSNKGYAYGIYLEWQSAKGGDWKVCTPLDPIIVNMD